MREPKTMWRYWTIGGLALLIAVSAAGGAAGQDAAAKADEDTLQTILERIHDHAAGQEWKKDGWKDERIEAWLERVVMPIAQAAKMPALKIPVRFGDVKATEAAKKVQDGLVVGKDVKLRVVRRSIVLCDGDFEADQVEDSIVIARSMARVLTWTRSSGARRSVIVAGTYAFIRDAGEKDSLADGSIIASRGWAEVNNSHASAVVAPEGIRMDGGSNSFFVNATARASDASTRMIRVPDLPLGKVVLHPENSKVGYVGEIYGRVAGGHEESEGLQQAGIVIRYDGRRYLAIRAKPIVDEGGDNAEIFRGWTLKWTDHHRTAIFGTGGADAVVHKEGSD